MYVNHDCPCEWISVENGRLKVMVKMCVEIMCPFTMESFEIFGKTEKSIVPEETRFIGDSLTTTESNVIGKNQASYCKENFLRDCSCHACGSQFCLHQRRIIKAKRDGREVPTC